MKRIRRPLPASILTRMLPRRSAVAAVALLTLFPWIARAEPVEQQILHTFEADIGMWSGNFTGGFVPLLAARDGNLYGTWYRGSRRETGLFRISTSGEYTLLHTLPAATEGEIVWDTLTEGPDGAIYGVTGAGGTYNQGTFFKWSADGTFSVLHAFNGKQNKEDVAAPITRLLAGTDGAFYGVAAECFYRITLDGRVTIVHRFGKDFLAPSVPLTVGPDGNFYGVTDAGGDFRAGSVFRLTPAGEVTELYSLSTADGARPLTPLVVGPDDFLYGLTTTGGSVMMSTPGGTVFKISTDGDFTRLHVFTAADLANGAGRTLTPGPDGAFYSDGASVIPALFRVTTTGDLTVLHAATLSSPGGKWADGPLTLGRDGNLYGVGVNVIFRIMLPKSATATADESLQPPKFGSGTDAKVENGVLTYTDDETQTEVRLKVARPAYMTPQMQAMMPGAQGSWLWIADDGKHAALINVTAGGSVTVTPMPPDAIRQLRGAAPAP